MTRVGYAPGCFDLFHIGHLNLLRRAKEECDFLIAGVVSDEILTTHKGITPVVPLAERLEIVRNVRYVDAAFPAMTADKLEIWRTLRFDVLLKGDDWRGTAKGEQLERDFKTVGVEVVYLPYTTSTSSTDCAQNCAQSGRPRETTYGLCGPRIAPRPRLSGTTWSTAAPAVLAPCGRWATDCNRRGTGVHRCGGRCACRP
jgi:glycerol-3-phosphate cytidylyltransferase